MPKKTLPTVTVASITFTVLESELDYKRFSKEHSSTWVNIAPSSYPCLAHQWFDAQENADCDFLYPTDANKLLFALPGAYHLLAVQQTTIGMLEEVAEFYANCRDDGGRLARRVLKSIGTLRKDKGEPNAGR